MKIDKNIPVPPRPKYHKLYDTFSKMDYESSILLKSKKELAALREYTQRRHIRLASRSEGKSIRVWKLKYDAPRGGN